MNRAMNLSLAIGVALATIYTLLELIVGTNPAVIFPQPLGIIFMTLSSLALNVAGLLIAGSIMLRLINRRD